MVFLDEALIQVIGGSGGNGCLAFRREKFEPRGGPSGGDGGKGGSVYLIGSAGCNTLYHLRGRHRYAAERGRHGEGSNRTGRSGEDQHVEVPLGTVVYERDTGDLMGEVVEDGGTVCVAKGGDGGRGNARFKTSTNRSPRRFETGWPGEEHWLRLELKLLADVGLVGLPNAGKSTLISAVSSAKPKVADYPFTTLVPQLGVVAEGGFDDPFVIADLPGLIAGAADGTGLGHQFLRHVERCRLLVHLVDLGALEADAPGDPVADLETLEGELDAFDSSLLSRQRMVVGSKLDIAHAGRRDALRQAAADRGLPYFELSAATHAGLKPWLSAVRRGLDPDLLEKSS